MTTEPFHLALANISAGSYDRAVALLARADSADDSVRVDLARCYIAVSSGDHRALLDPALARIASNVDLEREPDMGPLWYFFRILSDLLSRDDAVTVHLGKFAELVDRFSVNAKVVDLIDELLGALGEFGRADLVPPLHRLVENLEPPEPLGWAAWAELAARLFGTGAMQSAARICDAVLERAPSSRPWARAALTRGIILASARDFGQAREVLTRAFDVASTGGWRDLAELIQLNLLRTYRHAGDAAGLARAARDWLTSSTQKPAVGRALLFAQLFRDSGADLLALDLLSMYADHSWADEDGAIQLAWLEALVDVFHVLADDFAAAELCLRVIEIDDRVSQSALVRLGQEDYDRITRAYELLVMFYSELERFDEAACGRTVSYLEAAKEAAFSRALPGSQRHELPAGLAAEINSLTKELAALEAESERSMRGDFSGRAGVFRSVVDENLTGIVASATHECERDRDQRRAEIKNRLAEVRLLAESQLTRFSSFLGIGADTFLEVMAAAPWPTATISLIYRLDRPGRELVVYLVTPDGQIRRHVSDINPAALDALLTVLNHYPEEELDYIGDRLTEILVPDDVREILARSAAETLIVSGDANLHTVPWEALGDGRERLGLDFSLCRTPSLLRTASQISAAPTAELVIDRALIITNPTGDLPAAHEEGALVRRVLAASGVLVTELPSCTRDEFIEALPRYPLVHFAGHTNYLRTDPASSHFLFSDGPLTVSELQNVDLYPGALFVLGSCESAQAGQESNRDNSFGIGATLLLKGARVVIGSNWPARDAASLELADSFYSHLLDQGTVSSALLAARRDAYDSGNLATAWALLTVMGDPFMRCSIGQARRTAG